MNSDRSGRLTDNLPPSQLAFYGLLGTPRRRRRGSAPTNAQSPRQSIGPLLAGSQITLRSLQPACFAVMPWSREHSDAWCLVPDAPLLWVLRCMRLLKFEFIFIVFWIEKLVTSIILSLHSIASLM